MDSYTISKWKQQMLNAWPKTAPGTTNDIQNGWKLSRQFIWSLYLFCIHSLIFFDCTLCIFNSFGYSAFRIKITFNRLLDKLEIFKLVFYLGFIQWITHESLLNHLNGFCKWICKFQTKIDAYSLWMQWSHNTLTESVHIHSKMLSDWLASYIKAIQLSCKDIQNGWQLSKQTCIIVYSSGFCYMQMLGNLKLDINWNQHWWLVQSDILNSDITIQRIFVNYQHKL